MRHTITDEEINEVFTKDFRAEIDNQTRKDLIAERKQDKIDSPQLEVHDTIDGLEVQYSSSPHVKGMVMTAFYALVKKQSLAIQELQKELKNQK